VRVSDTNPSDVTAPHLSGTKSFAVTVNAVTPAVLTPLSLSAGQFKMQIRGAVGPDYILQVSTTLAEWANLWTNTPTAMPIIFTDTYSGSFRSRYYRALLGP
jgi:hypothetical protein